MFKETRAVQMLLGLGALMAASFLAHRFELYGSSWILDNFWSFWVLALIVLFQPELRRTLAHFGQSSFFQVVPRAGREQQSNLLDEVTKAAESLAGKRIGALVVLERTTGLRNYVELGVPLDALVSADLLESLFLPYSPLHDGAVFIRGGRVAAAGGFLPLSRNAQLARDMGTRHPAALGLSEETDAGVLVVSEETGRISLAVAGHMGNLHDVQAPHSRPAAPFSLGAPPGPPDPPGRGLAGLDARGGEPGRGPPRRDDARAGARADRRPRRRHRAPRQP